TSTGVVLDQLVPVCQQDHMPHSQRPPHRCTGVRLAGPRSEGKRPVRSGHHVDSVRYAALRYPPAVRAVVDTARPAVLTVASVLLKGWHSISSRRHTSASL